MRSGRRICLVIPARNEAESLPTLLRQVPSWVDEVFLVDNGSSDLTAEVARAAGATVVDEPRVGYGSACAAGLERAINTGAAVVVFMDADGSDDPAEMSRLVDPVLEDRAELVVGCRRESSSMPLHQRLGTQLVCLLLSFGFGQSVRDLGPFRAAETKALAALALKDRAYGWTAEMQARALRFGLEVLEVEVSWRPGLGRSEITGSWRGVLRAARDLIGCSVREIAVFRFERKKPPTP